MFSGWLTRIQQLAKREQFKDAAPVSLIEAVVRDENSSLATRVVTLLQWFLGLRVGQLVTNKVGEFEPAYDMLRSDVTFDPQGKHVRFVLKRGKGDRYNHGSCRYLMRATDPTGFSAVELFQRFWDESASKGFHPGTPLFRHLGDGHCVTRDHVSTLLKKHAARLGIDPSVIASHSARSGGASLLNAEGVDMEYIMQWGGWATESGCLKYLRATR